MVAYTSAWPENARGSWYGASSSFDRDSLLRYTKAPGNRVGALGQQVAHALAPRDLLYQLNRRRDVAPRQIEPIGVGLGYDPLVVQRVEKPDRVRAGDRVEPVQIAQVAGIGRALQIGGADQRAKADRGLVFRSIHARCITPGHGRPLDHVVVQMDLAAA